MAGIYNNFQWNKPNGHKNQISLENWTIKNIETNSTVPRECTPSDKIHSEPSRNLRATSIITQDTKIQIQKTKSRIY